VLDLMCTVHKYLSILWRNWKMWLIWLFVVCRRDDWWLLFTAVSRSTS